MQLKDLKIKPTKFAFKRNKWQGKFASFHPVYTDIRIKGRKVGYFSNKELRIRLMVVKEGGWDWVVLKYPGKDEDDLRKFLNDHFKIITEKYNLYLLEDD